jgi:hypothetical protein
MITQKFEHIYSEGTQFRLFSGGIRFRFLLKEIIPSRANHVLKGTT